jgi:hypothetical protein
MTSRRPRPGPAFLAALGLSLVLLRPAAAHAWGDEGHRVVALIAERLMNPAVRDRVAAMLASDPDPLTAHDIGAEASWADKFRDSPDPAVRARYDATWRWHFVNLELDRPDLAAACYGPARLPAGAPASQGPAQDCVVDKIAEFAAELADPATVPAERLLALKYLLHFVGDVHQPLHAADDHDAGGNKVRILAPGSTIPTLHVYWDVDAVGGQGRDAAALADGLLARILPAERAAWQAGGPADWAFESYGLAKAVAYGRLPPAGPDGVHRLDASYIDEARGVAALQLSRAGVRLAWLLDRCLGAPR